MCEESPLKNQRLRYASLGNQYVRKKCTRTQLLRLEMKKVSALSRG